MARIRTIKPQFFKDGDLFDAEERTKLPLRMAFAGLWTVADREGRFKWKPRDIKPDVLPFDNVSMAEVLDALIDCGKIQKYKIDGAEYGWIPGFLAHQHINQREAASEIPAPPQNKNARAKRVRAPDESVGKGKEGKGKEGDTADAEFDEFLKAYDPPKNSKKPDTLKAWNQVAEKRPPPAALLKAVAGYNAWLAAEWRKNRREYPAKQLASTWLRGEMWTNFSDGEDALTPEQIAINMDRADQIMRRGKYAPGGVSA